jgi:hypothetical protein
MINNSELSEHRCAREVCSRTHLQTVVVCDVLEERWADYSAGLPVQLGAFSRHFRTSQTELLCVGGASTIRLCGFEGGN